MPAPPLLRHGLGLFTLLMHLIRNRQLQQRGLKKTTSAQPGVQIITTVTNMWRVNIFARRLSFYNYDDYYPMRIGEVIQDHYKVVAKLGYGTSLTVWL